MDAGRLSPVELVEHYLGRIDDHDATVGAFITVDADRALEAAERARASRAPGDGLRGVPVAVKDLNHTAGVRTTFGSLLHKDFVPDVDDHVVELLARAGLINLGKTNVPEFGYPVYTENLLAPPARTPWGLDHTAGGSSGGAAAAVAAGLLPFAQGADGGGSIRIPCSNCGLFGIKPSRGRVSNGPLSADTSAASANGPIARTVADAAAMLDVMNVTFDTELHHAPSLPPGETFLGYATRDPGRLRIGRHRVPIVPGTEVDADNVAAWEDASKLLDELGHEVVDIEVPYLDEMWPHLETMHQAGPSARRISEEERAALTPLAEWMRTRSLVVPAADLLAAMKGLRMASRRAISATAGYDAVLTPTVPHPPRRVGWYTDGCEPERTFDRIQHTTAFTCVYNTTGQPSVSLPLWWNADGLPVGVMLGGRPFDEATLITLSAQLEAARPWRRRVPRLW